MSTQDVIELIRMLQGGERIDLASRPSWREATSRTCYEVVRGIAEREGFDFAVFWQPYADWGKSAEELEGPLHGVRRLKA